MKRIIIYIAILGLMFSFTNIIPLSALPVFLLIFIPYLVYKKNKLNKMFFWLFIMILYFAVNGILYDQNSFVEYDFYRRDGNVFITFSPLLVLLLFHNKINIEKIFDMFLWVASGMNLICLLIFFITGGTIAFYEEGIYHFLFEAHNAAGGFLMILTAVSIGKFLKSFNISSLFIFIINLTSLYLTDSRGSILGIIGGVILFVFMKKGYEKFLIYFILILQVFIYGWLYCNAPYNFLDESLMGVENIDSNFVDRGGTVINRGFYLWPRAIYLFLQSPIFGTGFGSYNDVPYHLVGVNRFLYNDSNIIYSDAHAHNTFLHIIAETGIIGLTLLLFFIKECNTFIKNNQSYYISTSLYISLWSSILSSITEHRFFTPSQMIPFVLLLGLTYISQGIYVNRNHIRLP